MSVLPVGFGSSGGYEIDNSLRFRSSASAYLSRTPGVASGQNQWTYSVWLKRGAQGTTYIISGNSASSGSYRYEQTFQIQSDGTFAAWGFSNGSGFAWSRTSARVFRDYSAWYHVVIWFDPDNGTSAQKLRVWVNNQELIWASSVDSGAGGNWGTTSFRNVNNTVRNDINGGYQGGGAPVYFSDGYQAECNMVSSSLVAVSEFGETNADGVWVPKAYTGTYGTNGFYLPFNDATSTTTLGYDQSSNSNNWTCNNISLTAGSTYDSMVDTPTNNYCVLNPLNKYSNTTLSAGNLKITTGSSGDGWCTTGSTFNFPLSGKWYCEFNITSSAGGKLGIGFVEGNRSFITQSGDSARFSWGRVYTNHNGIMGPSNASVQNTTQAPTWTTGDVISLAYDADNGTVWWAKNNTWTNSGNPVTNSNPAYSGLTAASYPMGFVATVEGYDGTVVDANFGQRPFAYTAPSGFKALCTANLPQVAIANPGEYFDVSLYTGNGAGQSITGLDFQPDWVWFKRRSASENHWLTDSVRGPTKGLYSNLTDAEGTRTDQLTSFNADGFSLGADAAGYTNISGQTYVAWNWKANGTGVTNTDGSITSTVSANQTAGFSIVNWTGNQTNSTIGHGLSVAPSMLIVKSRGSTEGWFTYHKSVGNTSRLLLNSTTTPFASIEYWNNTSPTSSVFTVGINDGTNDSGFQMIAYCFSEIAGYSKFGSYTGNGSTDGPFVYCGFRPRWIMTKCSSAATSDWAIYDTLRPTYNQSRQVLYADLSNAEASAGLAIDLLSNGFKWREGGGQGNDSGQTYIFAAFAEHPFGGSNTAPANAR